MFNATVYTKCNVYSIFPKFIFILTFKMKIDL